MSNLDQSEDENIYSVESIRKKRTVNNQNEYLIKWVGYEECTWENEDNIIDKEMIEIFEKEKSKKKSKNVKKVEDKKNDNKNKTNDNNTKNSKESNAKVVETKPVQDNKETVKKQESKITNSPAKKISIDAKTKKSSVDVSKPKTDNLKRQSIDEGKENEPKKRSISESDSVKRRTLDRKINTKTGTNFFNIDVSIVAVEEVYKDKEENTISAKIRYKNGTYAILPMDNVHAIAPLPLIYYYESKMVFSESKDE
ncbi:hypothetical protein BDAP_001470 [Binucleata daphniae]